MEDAEWEAAIDDLEFYNDWIDDQIVEQHYQEEHMDEELEELYENLDFYSDWIDELEELVDEKSRKISELEEQVEHQRKIILSLRNKNSQLVSNIHELLDEMEDMNNGYLTA